VTPPVPVPELVIVPVWLTLAEEKLMELELLELLFFKVRLPEPVVPFAVENAAAACPERLSSTAIVALPLRVTGPVVENVAVPLVTLPPPRTLS